MLECYDAVMLGRSVALSLNRGSRIPYGGLGIPQKTVLPAPNRPPNGETGPH